MYNKDEKSHWRARIVHVLLCLLTLLLVPATINSCLSTPSYGGGPDGAAMHALGLLFGWAVSEVYALVGLTLLHVVAECKRAIKIEPPALKVILAVALTFVLPFFVIPFAICSYFLIRYKKMTVPTLLWMLAASAIASFIAEDKMFSCSLFATMPIYGVISWWFDRRMAKHKEDGLA